MFGEDALHARQRAEIDRGLARLDVAAWHGPWTRRVLRLLQDEPGAAAATLAAAENRPVSRVKTDLWQLRELGLVAKAPDGYRLTARAESYLTEQG